MLKKSVPVVSVSAQPPSAGDGNLIANEILLSLSPEQRGQMLSKLELVRLKLIK